MQPDLLHPCANHSHRRVLLAGMNAKIFVLAIFFGSAVLAGCGPSATKPPQVETPHASRRLEILSADRTGITFRNTITEDDRANYFRYLYMYNGGGMATGDIDGDSLPDLAFVTYRGGCALYKNLGGLRFQDISASSGFATDSTWATGVCMADVNADGRLDIYVCASGPAGWSVETRRNKLFMNLGGGKFRESANEVGLADEGHNTMAYFADLDQDLDLDCFLVGHRSDFRTLRQAIADPQQRIVPEWSNRLYLNDGRGHFSEHAAEAGLASSSFGLGAAIGDLNGDGRNDIYVTNDFYTPDLMMINTGQQRPGEVPHFTDRLEQNVRHTSYFSMGVDRADYNNDGAPDLCVVDMTPSDHKLNKENMSSMAPGQFDAMVANGMHHQYMMNTLQLNNGNGTWSEVAQMAGVDRTDWSWGPLFVDLDNDGWKDLFITNGIVRDIANSDFRDQVRQYSGMSGKSVAFQPLLDLAPTHVPENMVYRNEHDLTFSKAMDTWDFHQKSLSNGAVYADLDRDGDMDLITINVNAPVTVIQNLTRENKGNGYLQLVLKGDEKNPTAIGSSATLYAHSGMQVCELFSGRGYMSSVEPLLHFGVVDERIDSVVIDWPDGKQTLLKAPERDHRMVVDRSSLRARPTPARRSPALFEEVSSELGLRQRHEENAFNDFAVETLLPQRQSAHGPAGAVADVNGDGRDDLFITASAGKPCTLLLQHATGTFAKATAQPWDHFSASEFIGCHFFDADGDMDMDLYLAAGSTEFPVGSELYRDRLFVNKGQGVFSYSEKALPDLRTSTQVVVSNDVDGDGDLDLFVGGRNVPGAWPAPPASHLLLNDNGTFTDGSATWLPALRTPGLINDALFADVDNDHHAELILCGEWMPLRILKSGNGAFNDIAPSVLDTSMIGWWQSLTAGDIDGDGDMDLLVGNLGLNNKFHPSAAHPLKVYMTDLDGSQTNDIVLAKTGDKCELPVRGRECSSGQMPFIKTKFPTYKAFANATLENIYGRERLSSALSLKVTTFASMVLVNENGRFTAKPLPMAAQMAPVRSIVLADLNGDGQQDLLIAGNLYGAEVETARYDTGIGLLLLGDTKHEFLPTTALQSGIAIPFDTRHLLQIELVGKGRSFIGVNNDGPLRVFAPYIGSKAHPTASRGR
jgi:enediyne biosynthesis protein E4